MQRLPAAHLLLVLTAQLGLVSATIGEEIGMKEVTAFHAAIARDDVATGQQMLATNTALLSSKLSPGDLSPLHSAAHADAIKTAEAMLKAGADFYARDINGQLALDIPAGQQINATRKRLREMNRDRNAFLGAVHEQKLDEVKRLLAADPTLKSARDIGDGWTPIMTAVHHDNADLLAILINAGCTLNGADFNNGFDAVYHCAEKGRAKCLQLLIDAGVDVTSTWRVGYGHLPMQMNALHVAAWKGQTEVVSILLKTGRLDVNARAASYALFSPLHFAATEGHTEIIRALLAAGADKTAVDGRRGLTAIQMAENAKRESAAAALR